MKGFIQTSVIVAVITSLIAVSAVGYIVVSKYKESKTEQLARENETQAQLTAQKLALDEAQKKIELLQKQIPTTTIGGLVFPKSAVNASSTEKKWHTAFTASGESSKTSQSFNLKGNKWRVTYSCKVTASYSVSSISIFGKYNSESETFGENCPLDNKVYEFSDHSSGEYYLIIQNYNTAYSVKIEDFY